MNRYSLLYQKLLWNFRELGFVEPLRRVLREVSREIVAGGQHLFSLPCADLPEASFSLPEGLTIRRFLTWEKIPTDYLDKLTVQVRKKHMREEIVAFYLKKLLGLFDDGASLTVAIMDDRIVANLWSMCASGNYQPYFSFFPLAPDEAILFAGFSLPGARGRNLMPALIRFNVETLGREGVKKVFASCKVWNEPSRRCIVKAGLKQIGTARPLRILGRRMVIWKLEGNSNA